MSTLAAEPISFLPVERFFLLAASAEVFVVADDIQYSTSSAVNRTCIKTATGPQWMTIPVLSKGRGKQKLDEVEIDNARPWQRSHWRTIEFNYHNAAYFGELADALAALYQQSYVKLVEAAWEFLRFLWNALGWKNLPRRTSEFGISTTGAQRLLELAKITGAEVYLANEKYRPLLKPESMPGVQIRFASWDLPPYHQQFGDFLPGMGILDLLFNEGVAFTRTRLQKIKA
jgi:hypothetical protein